MNFVMHLHTSNIFFLIGLNLKLMEHFLANPQELFINDDADCSVNMLASECAAVFTRNVFNGWLDKAS